MRYHLSLVHNPPPPKGLKLNPKSLPKKALRMWDHVYEGALARGYTRARAAQQAWGTVKRNYRKVGGRWVAMKGNPGMLQKIGKGTRSAFRKLKSKVDAHRKKRAEAPLYWSVYSDGGVPNFRSGVRTYPVKGWDGSRGDPYHESKVLAKARHDAEVQGSPISVYIARRGPDRMPISPKRIATYKPKLSSNPRSKRGSKKTSGKADRKTAAAIVRAALA